MVRNKKLLLLFGQQQRRKQQQQHKNDLLEVVVVVVVVEKSSSVCCIRSNSKQKQQQQQRCKRVCYKNRISYHQAAFSSPLRMIFAITVIIIIMTSNNYYYCHGFITSTTTPPNIAVIANHNILQPFILYKLFVVKQHYHYDSKSRKIRIGSQIIRKRRGSKWKLFSNTEKEIVIENGDNDNDNVGDSMSKKQKRRGQRKQQRQQMDHTIIDEQVEIMNHSDNNNQVTVLTTHEMKHHQNHHDTNNIQHGFLFNVANNIFHQHQHYTDNTNNGLNVNIDDNGSTIMNALQKENDKLKRIINDLQEENQLLHYEISNKIVLETFEGEKQLRNMQPTDDNNNTNNMLWCDELEDGQCPIEPDISFTEALRDRAYWLIGLLVLQSVSGIILAKNEALLSHHPFIIYFLTMLVGAGGNAGNQASVRVIRGLALGTLNQQTQKQFLVREMKMAGSLSILLSIAGFIRAAAFKTPLAETITVTIALFLIVLSSVCLGAVLPLVLKKIRIDPAHSSTSIQVIMDILGVVLAMAVSTFLLDSPGLGHLLVSKLGGGGGP